MAQWLASLSADAAPGQPGFQAQWLYPVVAVLAPALFGLLVAAGLRWLERLLGMDLSAGEY